MVFNSTRIAQLPFSNGQMHAHTRVMRGKGLGTGMGSVLLRRAGGGAGSSYQDIDDYVATTGINPYSRGKSKGQGFGLAAVKKLTEAMGGTVSFESEKGKGVKFTLKFFIPQNSQS